MATTLSPGVAPGSSTRERRRARTRRDIADTALALMLERGYDRVTVDDIAAAADIAPRTFFRYFASKDDVLFHDHIERIEAVRAHLTARPAGEPLIESLQETVRAVAGSYADEDDRTRRCMAIAAAHPALRAKFLDQQVEIEAVVAGIVRRRLRDGTGHDPDLAARVLTAAIFGAMRAAVDRWLDDPDAGPMADRLTEALDVLSHLDALTRG